MMDWKEVERKVFIFFKEHPVHAFRADTIADYLGLTEKEVRDAISHLRVLEIIEVRYQYATAELVALVDDMTKEK